LAIIDLAANKPVNDISAKIGGEEYKMADMPGKCWSRYLLMPGEHTAQYIVPADRQLTMEPKRFTVYDDESKNTVINLELQRVGGPGPVTGVKGAIGFKFNNLPQLYDKAKAEGHAYTFDTVVSSLRVKDKSTGSRADMQITKFNATDTVKVDGLTAGKAYTLYIELPDYNPMDITDFTPTEEQFKQ